MIAPRKGNDCGRRSSSRMISKKLRVAGSTGSLRTGTVVRNVTAWPEDVSVGILIDEAGGSRKGVVTSGGVSGGRVKGGIRGGGGRGFGVWGWGGGGDGIGGGCVLGRLG